MLEETACVLAGDRRDRCADGLHKRLPSPGLTFPKEALDLREGFFDRVEVRRVGWQVQKLRWRRLACWPSGPGRGGLLRPGVRLKTSRVRVATACGLNEPREGGEGAERRYQGYDRRYGRRDDEYNDGVAVLIRPS